MGREIIFHCGGFLYDGYLINYLASLIGISRGLFLGMPRNLSLPRKLLMNNFFNAVGKESSRYG
jgi:hypothetical protein